jgi:LmbE family N-acetylglucosaminyl deacetylase
VTVLDGPGTPESEWSSWPAPATWSELDLTDPPTRVVVVAPHPDDEVLGVGGLLTLLSRQGVAVVLVAVTDGEASHPGSPTLSPDQLRTCRADERLDALERLGVPAEVRRLGLADGGVASGEAELGGALHELLEPDDWCLATWTGDGHPDHEAVGRAATSAAAVTGARLLEVPIWTWHWATPDDPRVPWDRARRVSLPPDAQAAKQRAVEAYRSQIAPLSADPADAAILPPPVLARLLRPYETTFA